MTVILTMMWYDASDDDATKYYDVDDDFSNKQ